MARYWLWLFSMATRISRKKFLLSLPFAPLLAQGCKKGPEIAEITPEGLTKIKVGFMGITCEAPLFVAMENGFFTEQGIEVEKVRVEWSQFKDIIGLGGFHIGQQPVMMFLKPIEEGLDVKMTAGVHRGCLRVQAPIDGTISTVEDLRGKRIGVPGMGTPPFIFANRVLGRHKIDPRNEIEWRVFPSGELGLALQKGEVDAVATTEPIGSLLLAEGKVKNIADLGVDMPYAEEYCCSIMMNGAFVENNRAACAAATRAILKAAKWVEANPRAAARLSIEKGYLASNPELNTLALGALPFTPSVSGGRDAIRTSAQDMMEIGILSPSTDIAKVTEQIYVEFEGVTDEWLETVEVPTLADGQIPPDQLQRVARELATIGAPLYAKTCCSNPSLIVR